MTTLRVEGNAEKHEIYAAEFGGHLFMTYFYRAGGGHGPSPPSRSATDYVRPQCSPSLQELGIFSLSSRPVTDCWRHLQTLGVGMNGVNFISKAVQEGFFPALRNVYIMKTDTASALFNIPEIRILAAFGIFCHSPFEFDQSPFSRDICIYQRT